MPDLRGQTGVGRVAVVGIGGVGKEYVRELHSIGLDDLAIVDYSDQLAEHISDSGMLRNTFPGHEFTVQLKPDTPQIAADGGPSTVGHRLHDCGVTHIIHATPPTPHGRELFRELRLDDAWKHHVEKPYMSTYLDAEVSIGYLYAYREEPVRGLIRMFSPYQIGWRNAFPAPLVWDLVVHLLSLWPEEELMHISPFLGQDGVLYLNSPSASAQCGYRSDLVEDSVAGALREQLGWSECFRQQLVAFLRGEFIVTPVRAMLWEMIAKQIEREVLAQARTTSS